MAPVTKSQKQPQDTEQSDAHPTSDNTMLAQMMEMMKNITTRLEALETRSPNPAPAYPIVSSAPDTSASHAPQPQSTQSITGQEDKRWRPEEIGYFDGTGDVYAFVDRLSSIATNKGVKLIQTNLVTLFKDTAFNWYHYELSDVTKWALNTNALLDPWCQALIERFGPSHSKLMTQLEACQYTRKDAANKKDVTVYIQNIIRITKGLKWNQQDGFMTAFHHFESGLQRDLDPSDAGLTQFIRQVQLRQEAWYQVYATFGLKPRPPDLQPRGQQPQPYRPPARPPQQSYPPRPPQQSYPPKPPQQPYPPKPQQAYWAEEEEDWTYDPPTDSYHATPTNHPPGHTPRRYGNTHDDGGNGAMVHWTSAGEDHRCSHEGCTHYHWNSALNQHLVRLNLGHSAIRLLSWMDGFEGFMFIKIAIGECNRKSIDFRLIFSLYMHATAYPSLIRHSTGTFTSLSLPRCRYHLAMRTWHFLFFVGNCHGTPESCQDIR